MSSAAVACICLVTRIRLIRFSRQGQTLFRSSGVTTWIKAAKRACIVHVIHTIPDSQSAYHMTFPSFGSKKTKDHWRSRRVSDSTWKSISYLLRCRSRDDHDQCIWSGPRPRPWRRGGSHLLAKFCAKSISQTSFCPNVSAMATFLLVISSLSDPNSIFPV